MALAPTTQPDRPLTGTEHKIASQISVSLAPALRAPLIWTEASGL